MGCISQAHEGRINALLLSPDNLQLFSASSDKTIKVWDTSALVEVIQTGRLTKKSQITADNGMMGVVVSVPIGLLSVLQGHQDSVTCLTLSQSRSQAQYQAQYQAQTQRMMLFSGSEDGVILIWDVHEKASYSLLNRIETSCQSLNSLVYSQEDGILFSSSSDEKVIKLWRI
jgi:WD40 repeat protein